MILLGGVGCIVLLLLPPSHTSVAQRQDARRHFRPPRCRRARRLPEGACSPPLFSSFSGSPSLPLLPPPPPPPLHPLLQSTIFSDSNCLVNTDSISVVAPSGCFVLPSAVSSPSGPTFKSVSVTCGSGAAIGTSKYSTMAFTDRQCTQNPTLVSTSNSKLFAAVPQPSCTDNALYPNVRVGPAYVLHTAALLF